MTPGGTVTRKTLAKTRSGSARVTGSGMYERSAIAFPCSRSRPRGTAPASIAVLHLVKPCACVEPLLRFGALAPVGVKGPAEFRVHNLEPDAGRHFPGEQFSGHLLRRRIVDRHPILGRPATALPLN
jgi:hypothetical protein